MTFTIAIPSWSVPAAITILMFAIAHIHAWWVDRNDDSGFIRLAAGITWMIWCPIVIFVSMASWLVWALWFK